MAANMSQANLFLLFIAKEWNLHGCFPRSSNLQQKWYFFCIHTYTTTQMKRRLQMEICEYQRWKLTNCPWRELNIQPLIPVVSSLDQNALSLTNWNSGIYCTSFLREFCPGSHFQRAKRDGRREKITTKAACENIHTEIMWPPSPWAASAHSKTALSCG